MFLSFFIVPFLAIIVGVRGGLASLGGSYGQSHLWGLQSKVAMVSLTCGHDKPVKHVEFLWGFLCLCLFFDLLSPSLSPLAEKSHVHSCGY